MYTAKKHVAQALSVIGNTLSIVSMSLLNLLSILPKGVTSKNDVDGARTTFDSKSPCNSFDAFRVPM